MSRCYHTVMSLGEESNNKRSTVCFWSAPKATKYETLSCLLIPILSHHNPRCFGVSCFYSSNKTEVSFLSSHIQKALYKCICAEDFSLGRNDLYRHWTLGCMGKNSLKTNKQALVCSNSALTDYIPISFEFTLSTFLSDNTLKTKSWERQSPSLMKHLMFFQSCSPMFSLEV